MIHLFQRAAWHLFFWSLLLLALSLTALRISLHAIGHFKQEVAHYVADRLGAPVLIGHLDAKMQGFTPQLRLQQVSVASLAQPASAIQLQEIRIRLDLWSLLAKRTFWPATSITLVGAKLTLQRGLDGSFSILGLRAGDAPPYWLLQGNRYEMLQSEITFKDLAHPSITLEPAAVDLAIDNADGLHDIKAIIRLPRRYGGSLSLAMELTGNFFSSEQFDGRVYLETRGLNTTTLINDYFPYLNDPGSGVLESRLWAQIKQAKLKSLQGEINLARNSEGHPHSLAGRFHWRQTKPHAEKWRLDVPKLTLTTDPKKPVTENRFSVAGDFSLRDWAWSITHLNLSDAAHIGQWLLPATYAKKLTPYQATGSLNNFTGIALPGQSLFAVRGQFKRIGLAPVSGQPGFNGLSGTVIGNQQQGLIKLASYQAHFNHPGLFRQELAIKTLEGAINWQQTDSQWLLSSPSVKITAPGINSEGKLRLTLSKQSDPPFLDWQMVMSNPDVRQLRRYLPANIMKPVDVDWFDAAFIKGRIEKGEILYYGPLGPLTSAVFRALLDVDGIELRYDPEWPVLTDVKSRVSFVQNKMVCEISRGRSLKLDLIGATVTHPAINASKQLLISGEIAGTLPDALAFLSQTELNDDVGRLIAAVRTEGPTRISLDLDLALNTQGRTRLNGKARLNSARLNVKAIDLWLENLTGELTFNETGVYSDSIKASALNHPIAVTLSHEGDKTRIKARGKAGVDDLEQQFALPLSDFAKGSLAYQLAFDLPPGDSPPTLNMVSDLSGVGLDLPEPLAKRPEQRKPLTLDFNFVAGLLLPLKLNYNNQFKAAIRLDTDTQTIHSGNFLLGTGNVTQASGNHLNITINYPDLDLSALGGLAATSIPRGNGAAPAFTRLTIDSRQARWKNQPLGAFKLTLAQKGNAWVGEIASTIAQGHVRIPVNLKPSGKAIINLKRLDLSALGSSGEKQPALTYGHHGDTGPTPQKLPLFAITSDQFLWQGVDLGRLSLTTERIIDGIAIKQAELTGSENKLQFDGRWRNLNGKTATELKGSLTASKVGPLLNRLDITRHFKETDAQVNFLLRWNAPPYDPELCSLSGKLDATLKNGRILSVEPGYWKLLGLVAMAQWDKRLQLDFRDVFEDGLSFNTIKGNVTLNHGVAVTDNLVVDAIPAKISLTGTVDLTNKTLDQIVRAIPKSADAFPIAGTIIESLVNMASRTLTGTSQEVVLLGSEYRIQGGWEDLSIVPTQENDGLVNQAWDTLRDFLSAPFKGGSKNRLADDFSPRQAQTRFGID